MHILSTYIFYGCTVLRFFTFTLKNCIFCRVKQTKQKKKQQKSTPFQQEIQKSTYFVFHSHKTQKVMSTFFYPMFCWCVQWCGNSCTPSIIRLAATQLAEIQCCCSNENCSARSGLSDGAIFGKKY